MCTEYQALITAQQYCCQLYKIVVICSQNLGRLKNNNTFCGFSMGSNQYWSGRLYDFCVYFITKASEGSTESVFMERPRIEAATPGLQGIGLSPTPQPLLFGQIEKETVRGPLLDTW